MLPFLELAHMVDATSSVMHGDASTFSLFVSRGCCLSSWPFGAARSCTNGTTYIMSLPCKWICIYAHEHMIKLAEKVYCFASPYKQLDVISVFIWTVGSQDISGFPASSFQMQTTLGHSELWEIVDVCLWWTSIFFEWFFTWTRSGHLECSRFPA